MERLQASKFALANRDHQATAGKIAQQVRAKLIRKRYVRGQAGVLGGLSFASVVIPIMPMMRQYYSLYVPWVGEYDYTFAIDKFLIGAIVGALTPYSAPFLSRMLTRLRGDKRLPRQGMMISLATLLVASGLLEVAL